MEKKHIRLIFDQTVTRLAGFKYGMETYDSQVGNCVDFSCDQIIVIEFPEQIIRIASSFVQGFFEKIIKQIGLESIGSQVEIQTGDIELTKSIFKNLT